VPESSNARICGATCHNRAPAVFPWTVRGLVALPIRQANFQCSPGMRAGDAARAKSLFGSRASSGYGWPVAETRSNPGWHGHRRPRSGSALRAPQSRRSANFANARRAAARIVRLVVLAKIVTSVNHASGLRVANYSIRGIGEHLLVGTIFHEGSLASTRSNGTWVAAFSKRLGRD
jgi:hypothetical protein